MQVVKESKESKDKSKFRSALLTRCQNTFEEKRMSEINNKKTEMEKETDVSVLCCFVTFVDFN